MLRRSAAVLWLVLICAVSVWAAFVEVTGCSNTSSASTVVCTMNTTANNIVYIGAEENGTDPLTIASTGVGDSWTAGHVACVNGSQTIRDWWMIPTNSTTSDAITVTAVGGGVFFMGASGGTYSGAATTIPIDSASPCGTGNSTAPATGTWTATSGDLIVAFALAGGGSIAHGTGFTMNWQSSFVGEEFQTLSGTSPNATFTAGSGAWAALGLAIKTSGGGATVVSRRR